MTRTRPTPATVAVHELLIRRSTTLRSWAECYESHTRAHMIRAADQLGAAAERLNDDTDLEECWALLEATEALATLTDE